MKKIINLMFATALVCGATFLSSCNDAISVPDNPTPPEAEDVEEIYSEGGFVMSDEFKYAGKAYINSTVNADVAKVLEQLMSNRQQAIDENTNVIVLNKLSDLPFDKLEEAYYNGAIIAVALPVKSEIDAFFAAHPDWDAPLSDQDMDDALLYAFDFDGYDWTVVGKENDNSRVTLDDPNDAFLLDDPFFAPMKEAPKWPTTSEDGNYTEEDLDYLLSSWTKGLEEERTLSEEIKKEQENEVAQARAYLMTRAAADNTPAPVNVKTAFAYKTYGKTFKRNLRSRWTKNFDMTADDWRDDTSIGSTLSVRYNVYTVHVYDGSSGEGDYYLINMEADMNFGGSVQTGYKKHKIDHNYYWIGPFGKGFAVSTCPATTTDPKTSKDYTDSEVVFLGGKGAIPETTQGSTSYSDEYSFSFKLDASISVKGEASKETSGADVKGKVGISAEGKASVGWGWNWAEKVQRSVGDVSIKNSSWRGNDQYHEIVYENLPKSDKTKGWIEQKGNNSYKATTKLKSTWGWYKKSERDDSENNALVLHVRGRIDYQWWYHDGAGWFNIGNIDEHKAHNHEWINSYIQLDPIFRKRVGQIELVNDLGDKIYIKNIKVYSKDDPNQVVTFSRTYPAKEKINLGCRLVTGKYIIEFDAQEAGMDKVTHYKYSSHDYLPLDHKVPNVFYAGTDFKAQ
jgi:hypothetical protein